ncbi:MAG: ECF-type sigma factor [Planctomycetota bacterium]|jgi:RNA polymerase sigma factor (TIGR02999 family)
MLHNRRRSSAGQQGDPSAAEQLLPLVYDELRKLAAQKMAQEPPGQTLQATALVHEAYVRLAGENRNEPWRGRRQFFAAAAEAMRRILVEAARRKKSIKRGGGFERQVLEPDHIEANRPAEEILALHDALEHLAEQDPLKADLVAETGEPLSELPIPIQNGNSLRRLGPLWDVSPDGRTVATTSRTGDGSLQLWDARSGRPLGPPVETQAAIGDVRFSPRGDRILTTSSNSGHAQLWQTDGLVRIGPRIQQEGRFRAIAFTPDGETLITLGSQLGQAGTLYFWDPQSGHRLGPPVRVPVSTSTLAASPGGKTVALGGRAALVFLVDLPNPWEHEGPLSTAYAEAITGGELAQRGDIDSLEGPAWQQRVNTWLTTQDATDDDHASLLSESERRLLFLTRGAVGRADTEAVTAANEQRSDIEPDSWAAWLRRMGLAAAHQRWDEAAEDLQAALARGPRDVVQAWLQAYAAVGQTSGPGGERSERMLWYCDRLLEIDSEDYLAHMIRTTVLVQADKPDDAEQAFAKALATGPRDLVLEHFRSLARQSLLRTAGQTPGDSGGPNPQTATWLLDHVIDASPDHWPARLDRAQYAVAEGRLGHLLRNTGLAGAGDGPISVGQGRPGYGDTRPRPPQLRRKDAPARGRRPRRLLAQLADLPYPIVRGRSVDRPGIARRSCPEG